MKGRILGNEKRKNMERKDGPLLRAHTREKFRNMQH
jgi:hypothetical protein